MGKGNITVSRKADAAFFKPWMALVKSTPKT